MDALSKMMPLGTSVPTPAPKTDKEAAKQFEMLFVKQLVEQMPLPGLEDSEMSSFLGMFHDALAQQLVEGGGVGLAEQIEATLARRTVDGALPPPMRPSGTASGVDRSRGYPITAGFGMRADPFDGRRRAHEGIDMAAPTGAPIRAARDGVVRFAGASGGYGTLVVVDHGDGLETRYGHCDSLSVKPGDPVAAGQAIATVGSTGRSTGPHLHFEVRRDGVAEDPEGMADDVLR